MTQDNFIELNKQGYTIIRNLVDENWLNTLREAIDKAFIEHRTTQLNNNNDIKTIVTGDLTIDPGQYKTILNGVTHILAKKEFELLYLLAAQPGRVFLRNEILAQVWGNDVIVGDRTIDVHIRKIRVKLGIDCITTVKGVGYKFDY
jgi:two-component system alkaline phosphatase synthesis response regulator PhoP